MYDMKFEQNELSRRVFFAQEKIPNHQLAQM